MPRKEEVTMLDMSVIRPSIAPELEPDTDGAAGDSAQEAPKKVVEFSKLRGKAKTVASEHFEEILKTLPRYEDEQARETVSLQTRREALERILNVLGESADHIPMDALGDFEVVALNPVPFAEAVEQAAGEYEAESPERPKNVLPVFHENKMKTSASLNRLSKAVSNQSKSTKGPNSALKPNRAVSADRSATTPLKLRRPGNK